MKAYLLAVVAFLGTIAAGGSFTAAEAQRVADAFLWLLDDEGER